MSVEPTESVGEVWAKWQGHVIDGSFPLRRYLGSSDHSAVFVTELSPREPCEVALKLVPTIPGLAESQLSDWNIAAGLPHQYLLRLWQTGQCQLDGQPYLYVVMEYADQNLAQVLKHRALTEDETREMLLPALNALAFLHTRNLVQGQLKPTNILAVGDQLKLSSDTIRRISEAGASRRAVSVYDPPEARDGSYSCAGDIWGLGVCLFEALTRRPPSGLDERTGAVVLPRDFSPAFREIVAGCLSRRPYDRPKVTEIEAWVRRQFGGRASDAALQAGAIPEPIASDSAQPRRAIPKKPARASGAAAPVSESMATRTRVPISRTSQTAVRNRTAPETTRWESAVQSAHRLIMRAVERGHSAAQQFLNRRSLVAVSVGAVGMFVLTWAGVHALRTHRNSVPPAHQAPRDTALQTPNATAPAGPSSVLSAANTKGARVEAATSLPGIHADIPNVPLSARQTIHGHIRVAVRVMVDSEGTVYAALADQPGPSRYFERLAIESAKKWTFPPADTPAPRLKLVRFEFTREGTKGHVVALE